MAVTGTWKVIITRLNKSKLRYSEQREYGPRRGDILEKVIDGKLVKAEVEMSHHDMAALMSGPSKPRKSSCNQRK
jgi:hypothetical protein